MTSLIRRAILALTLIAGLSPAFAQAPGPVPALPDTERRQSYSISASTCACAVNFAIFGEGIDYANWIEVFVNGALMPQFGNWGLTSPSGSIGTLPRPITDAVLTFNTAQTGVVQIVGARRPRRISQFAENRGVAARDLNQVLTDIIAQNRENWDKTNDVTGRAILAPPGETLTLLAAANLRANQVLGFDGVGNIALYSPASAVTSSANVNFLQAGTGAVSRTVQDELRDTIKASQYGTAGTPLCGGVADDAPAVQRAINYANTIGNPTILLPAGTCRFNSTPFLNTWTGTNPLPLTIPGLSIKGAGRSTTTIDNRTSGFAIAVNPDWKAAHLTQSTLTSATVGGTLGASAPVGTLGAITAGSLYTNGTYNGVALTGGSGTGATANIVVSGAAVTSVTLVNPGTGYAVGNTLSATAASIGGTGSGFSIPVASATYYVLITVNDPLGNEIKVTLTKSASITVTTGAMPITLAPLNAGYSYTLYCGTTTTPANYCFASGADAKAYGGGQAIVISAIGSAHAFPTDKLAIWQTTNISDLAITSTTNTPGASGISWFKVGYSTLSNVYIHHMSANTASTGFELTDYTGDLDGSFNVAIHNSKFDTIGGNCVYAAGLALELTNFTVDDRTIFNICGTLPTNIGPTHPFTISSITNATTPVVTTSVAHTLQARDEVYISGVTGMTLANNFYRACGTVAATTFQLCDINGAFIDTTALGAYTASSGSEYLAWRPPSATNGVTGCLVWMGLIGTFENLDFTQCNNFSMYFSEIGSSDNATIKNVDYENTYGVGLYVASLVGGSFTNSECLSATIFGPTIHCVVLGTGFNAGGVQNFQIRNIKVRNDVAPALGFMSLQNTNSGVSFIDSIRLSNIQWQNFDNANQTRAYGFAFDPIPGQVQFSISATNVAKLVPIGYGGALPIHLKAKGEWIPVQIAAAGITQSNGGASPNTTYNFFAYNSAATTLPIVIAIEFSTTGAAVDAAGYWVKVDDASRTFVGQATTDGSGNFQTTGLQTSQYPIRTALPLALSGGALGCPTCVLISGTAHGDSAYAILSTDRYVYTNAAFTVPRTWTLPPANSLAVGTTIWVQDAQNTVTSTNTLTVQRAGADTVNISSTALVISGAGGGITFTTDGVSNWGVPVQTVSTGGSGRQTLTNHGVLVGAGTNPITQLAVATTGQTFCGVTGADPQPCTISGDATLGATGVLTVTKTNNVSFGALATVTPGTGVAAAAAVNANAPGSFIVNAASAILQGSPTDPTGSTTEVMMGLGVTTCKLTPVQSTRVHLEFQGQAQNASAGGMVSIQARYGSGAAPANAAALTGTSLGSKPRSLQASAGETTFFRAGGNITGLTVGTAYWFDLGVGNLGTGTTASVTSISCDAFEIP